MKFKCLNTLLVSVILFTCHIANAGFIDNGQILSTTSSHGVCNACGSIDRINYQSGDNFSLNETTILNSLIFDIGFYSENAAAVENNLNTKNFEINIWSGLKYRSALYSFNFLGSQLADSTLISDHGNSTWMLEYNLGDISLTSGTYWLSWKADLASGIQTTYVDCYKG